MNQRIANFTLAILVLLVACKKDPGTEARLGELEQEFKTNGSASAASATVPTGTQQKPAAGVLVQNGLAAIRADQPADGIILLQSAQKLPNLNASQRMAVQHSIQAVTADLVNRASRGDNRARADLKRIEAFLGQN